MIAKVAFQVIQVTVKDWEMEGRKGTSHKAQLLIDNDGLPSTLTVKFDANIKLERGNKYVGNIEVSDTNNGYLVKLISINSPK